MNTQLKNLAPLALLLASACGDGDKLPDDYEPPSGMMDAGRFDAGPLDARVPEGGVRDGSVRD